MNKLVGHPDRNKTLYRSIRHCYMDFFAINEGQEILDRTRGSGIAPETRPRSVEDIKQDCQIDPSCWFYFDRQITHKNSISLFERHRPDIGVVDNLTRADVPFYLSTLGTSKSYRIR